MKRIVPILLLVLLVGACASLAGAEKATQKVFALQADYSAYLATAVAYESQPRCLEGIGSDEQACSEVEIVDKLRWADNHAYDTLQAAQKLVRSIEPDEEALSIAVKSAAAAVEVFRDILTREGGM